MFIGELFYKWSPCHRFSTTDITRLSIQESYLAITPGAAECIAEQIAQTRIGRYDMTQSNLEILFGNYDWKVHANQDLGEYDVTAGWTVRTETPRACMARCLREPKCRSIMWASEGFRKTNMRKLYWLKTKGEDSSLYVPRDNISVYIRPDAAEGDKDHSFTTSSLKPKMPIFE